MTPNDLSKEHIFFLDSMLGKLCIFLRILGENCVYVGDEKANTKITNSLVFRNLKNKINIFITRNKKKDIIKRLQKYNIIPDHILIIPYTNILSQLRIIKETFPSIVFNFEEEKARCSICGSSLIRKHKKYLISGALTEKVNKAIPPKVLEHHEYFYYCPYCNKYYWKGKHWNNISEVLKQLSYMN